MAGIDREPDKPVRTDAERRRRINQLKKMIVAMIVLAILLPVLLCIILFLKVGRLEHKVRELETAREVRLAGQMRDDMRLSAGSGETGYLAQPGENTEGAETVLGVSAGADLTVAGEHVSEGCSNEAGDADSMDENGMDADGAGDADSTDGNGADADKAGGAGGVDGSGIDADGSEIKPEDAEELSGEQLYPDYRKVYLTFDDGPSTNTEAILEILDRYGVKATFFVVGKTDEHSQEMYRRIVEAGHTLGMHSYSHKYSEIYASAEAFTEDLEKIRSYLYDMTGLTSCFYRFPGGSSNALSSTDVQELIDVLDERDILYFDWNIVNGDAGSVKLTAEQLADNVTNNMERYRTAIVLMHDAAGKPETVEALPTIIERILQMDQTVILPITEDTARIQQVKAEDE